MGFEAAGIQLGADVSIGASRSYVRVGDSVKHFEPELALHRQESCAYDKSLPEQNILIESFPNTRHEPRNWHRSIMILFKHRLK